MTLASHRLVPDRSPVFPGLEVVICFALVLSAGFHPKYTLDIGFSVVFMLALLFV